RDPVVEITLWNGKRAPTLFALEYVRILGVKNLRFDRTKNFVRDFLRSWPEITQKNWSVVSNADRLGIEVDVHPARECVRNNERRRRQIVEPGQRIDSSLEVSISCGNRSRDDV